MLQTVCVARGALHIFGMQQEQWAALNSVIIIASPAARNMELRQSVASCAIFRDFFFGCCYNCGRLNPWYHIPPTPFTWRGISPNVQHPSPSPSPSLCSCFCFFLVFVSSPFLVCLSFSSSLLPSLFLHFVFLWKVPYLIIRVAFVLAHAFQTWLCKCVQLTHSFLKKTPITCMPACMQTRLLTHSTHAHAVHQVL